MPRSALRLSCCYVTCMSLEMLPSSVQKNRAGSSSASRSAREMANRKRALKCLRGKRGKQIFLEPYRRFLP
jgi:hypothetical protein